MNNKSRLRINTIINFVYEIICIITPFITAPYISRILGSSGVGVSSYAKSLVTYFTMFATLGVAAYGKREIGRLRDNKERCSQTFWEIELLVFLSSIICLTVWIAFSFIYVEYKIYLLILSFNIISVIFNISWFYFGLEKYIYTVAINFIFKIVDVIAIYLMVKTKNDVFAYIAISSVTLLLGNISMWFFLPKKVGKPFIQKQNLKPHLKEMIIYFIPTISTTIYMILDKTLIGAFSKNSSENGYYEQATNLINMVRIVAYSNINSVINSRINYLYKENDHQTIKQLSYTAFNITTLLSVGACFGLICVSSVFVPLFFGEDFYKTTDLIYILSFIIPIMCISDGLGALYYTPSGRRKESTKYLLIGFAVNLVINLCLIPFIGAIGAAVASIIGELVITALYLYNCHSFLTSFELMKLLWKKIFAGAVMLIACFVFKYFLANSFASNVLFFVLQVFVGLIIYVVTLLLTKDESLKDFLSFFFKK